MSCVLSLPLRQRLHSGWVFIIYLAVDVNTYNFFGQFPTLVRLMAHHVGAKQTHFNLHFVWIFRYSCLRQGDSSWCSWASHIYPVPCLDRRRCIWANTAPAGPGSPQIPPATPSTQEWSELNKHLQRPAADTFSMSLLRWWRRHIAPEGTDWDACRQIIKMISQHNFYPFFS